MNEALLQAFLNANLSNYRLAKLTGLSASTVGRWVNGETELTVQNAEKIASAIGVKLTVTAAKSVRKSTIG